MKSTRPIAKRPTRVIIAATVLLIAWTSESAAFGHASPLRQVPMSHFTPLASCLLPLTSDFRDEGLPTNAIRSSRVNPVVLAVPLPATGAMTARPATTATEVGPAENGDSARSALKDRFQRLLWQRLRGPLFLFVLGVVFLVLLALSLRGHGPTRLRSLTTRSLFLSLIIHLMLLLVLDSWVLSQRILRTIRDPQFEILLDSDNLAEEKISMGIREETAELPLADSAVALAPKWAELTLPEITPAERKPPVAPGRVDFDVFDLPTDLTGAKPSEKSDVAAPLAAQLLTDFRVVAPQVALKSPRAAAAPRQNDTALPSPEMPLAKVEQPVVLTPTPRPPKTDLPPTNIAPTLEAGKVEIPSPQAALPEMPDRISAPKPLPDRLALPMPATRLEVARVEQPSEPTQERAPKEPTVERHVPLKPPIATPAKARPVAPGTPLTASLTTLPAPLGSPTAAIAEPTVPRRVLVPRPSPKPVPPPFVLDEQPEIKEPYRLRRPEERAKVLERLGGSPETEEAVRLALGWLAAHQSDDGRWDIDGFDARCGQCGGPGEVANQDIAATALSVLAFLGAGHTHQTAGPYRDVVARAVAWLAAQVREDGDLRGRGNMYDQAMATIALAEALGMTRDASLAPVIERAVAFIASAQHPETGGWRYFPGDEGDTSVFGWQVMALKSALMAGLSVPPQTLELSERWLERVGGGEHGGLYGYQSKTPSPAMAAEGMFSRLLLGRPPDDPAMVETAEYLHVRLPDADDPNMYYWYYGTLALFQHQGPAWPEWNRAMRKVLLTTQEKSGARRGSWPPVGQWAPQGGRVVHTAMAALCLEVYYRYLPLYKKQAATLASKPKRK